MIRNKIDAIKKIRELNEVVNFVRSAQSGRLEIIPALGLREAKDLVEEIMLLGKKELVAEYQATLKFYERTYERTCERTNQDQPNGEFENA